MWNFCNPMLSSSVWMSVAQHIEMELLNMNPKLLNVTLLNPSPKSVRP
jgi:hypothetical protein